MNCHPCDSLIDVGGMPAICYVSYDDVTYEFSYVYRRALGADGSEWTEVVLDDPVTYPNPYSYPLLLAVDGKPVVLYQKADAGQSAACVHQVRALDELGDTWDDPAAIVSLAGSQQMDAAVVDGLPVLAYRAAYSSPEFSTSNGLYYAAATDATATDWAFEYVATLSSLEGDDHIHLATSNGAPVIAVNHFDQWQSGSGSITVFTPVVP